eukprot:c9374_g1_i1.p1 GENE.c9374_g1_i1~~c9374_g1_i1.p1  ORF type:complete len:733 (-),score=235.98 c9374_g1_i1:34-2232(-)
MNFDLSSPQGLKVFDKFISTRTFVNGFVPTADDVSVFGRFNRAPGAEYPHANRYFNTVSAFTNTERAAFPATVAEPADKKAKVDAAGAAAPASGAAPAPEGAEEGKISKSQQKKDAKKAKKEKGDDEFKTDTVEFSTATSAQYEVNTKLSPLDTLKDIFTLAVTSAFPDAKASGIEEIRILRRGNEFQVNTALDIFKNRNAIKNAPASPKDAAAQIVAHIPKSNILVNRGITPQGFIMVEFDPKNYVHNILTSQIKCGVRPPYVSRKETVVVDFSSPNIAKQMHVGHLRSTIIGDTMCRVLEFLGHDVIRTNHVGDWGTQFGMLLCHLQDSYPDFAQNPTKDIGDLTRFYKAAKKRFDEEEGFKERAQRRVVELQSGEPVARSMWQMLCDISRIEFSQIYSRLDIKLEERGESFYNPYIPDVIKILEDKQLVQESKGATCVFVDPKLPPLMVRKSDGGYGYDSTDIAAIHYRIFTQKATLIIVITDVGQAEHFHLINETARMAGWLTDTRVYHIGFGLVQDSGGQKFKTRSGDTVPLSALLDEAITRMKATLTQRITEQRSPLTLEEVDHAATVIGHASVKYFDLRQNPSSNYIFAYDKMLDDRGDTAVYLLYSRARIHSILRKAERECGVDMKSLIAQADTVLELKHETEIALGLELVQLSDVVQAAIRDLQPNVICKYLYDVAGAYSKWNNVCKVLNSPEMNSRLLLTHATMQTMDKCLNLLGIQPLDKI